MISKLFRDLKFWGFCFLLSPVFVLAQSRTLLLNKEAISDSNQSFFRSTAEPAFTALVKSNGWVVLKSLFSETELSSVEIERAGDDKRFASIGSVAAWRRETLFPICSRLAVFPVID